MFSAQGQWRGCRARPGLRGPPQLSTDGLEEPLRLLPAPRGLLILGPAGRAVHSAAAREQEEAAAPDAGRRGAVQAPPTGQEEEGQRAAARYPQPRDLKGSGRCRNQRAARTLSSITVMQRLEAEGRVKGYRDTFGQTSF